MGRSQALGFLGPVPTATKARCRSPPTPPVLTLWHLNEGRAFGLPPPEAACDLSLLASGGCAPREAVPLRSGVL